MNFLKKLVVGWVKEDWNTTNEISKKDAMIMMEAAQAQIPRGRSIDANGFNLRVYKAVGGTIIEVTRHDNRLRVDDGRSSNGLYIVTDDKELGAEIGKIITMEGLKA